MIFNESNFPKLPSTWSSVLVGESCDLVTIKHKIKKKDYLEEGSLAVIDQGSVLIGGYTNEVLFAVDTNLPVVIFGDHTRILKYIDFSFAAGADGIKVLCPKEFIDPKLFFHFLQTVQLPNKGYARHFKHLRSSKIAFPPLNEQKRIAEKLEQLLTAVDATKNRLDKVPTLLKRFRQSVLAAAVSGELTKEWRAENKITEEWLEASLESIAVSITDGDHQAPPKVDNGISFLVISNLSAGKLDFDSVTRFVPPEYYDSLKESRVPNSGDILYTVTGSFGIPVIVDDDRKFCFQRHIAIIKPNHEIVDNKYLMYALSSNELMSQAISCATGTAQKTVPLRGLRKFTIPMPSKIEQLEISARVDTLFKFVDNCEDQLKKTQQKVTSIHASILAKAFRGELVPQDPNDEPATLLLKKISEKKRTEKAHKPVRRKKKAMPSKANKGSLYSIVEILQSSEKIMSAQQLLAVFAPGSPDSEKVEDFFVALRDCLTKKEIMQERKGDEDWFSLATGTSAS